MCVRNRRRTGAALAVLTIIATVAAPAAAITRQPTTIGIGLIVDKHPASFLIYAQVLSAGASGGTVITDPPAIYTITDATAARRVRTFKWALTGPACRIKRLISRGTITFSAAKVEGCPIRTFTGPAKDRYTVRAFYPGSAQYQPSTSKPLSL